MIGIIDYGMGNLGSVTNACQFLGLPARILAQPGEAAECTALILPGVGAFGDCMKHLREHGWVEPVCAWIRADRPFLGICLGLQVLFEGSEESPGVPGLGVLPGLIRRFPDRPGLKVPQIGWNGVRQVRPDLPLFRGISDGAFFYFVHSFRADAEGRAVAGCTDFGGDYGSVVWQGRMAAVQFHPEKSQRAGLQLLRNYAAWSGVQEARP